MWAAAAQPKLTLQVLVLHCSFAEATGDACSRTGQTGPSVIWWKNPVGDATAKARREQDGDEENSLGDLRSLKVSDKRRPPGTDAAAVSNAKCEILDTRQYVNNEMKTDNYTQGSDLNRQHVQNPLHTGRVACCRHAGRSASPPPLHHRKLNINVNVFKTRRRAGNVNEAHTKG